MMRVGRSSLLLLFVLSLSLLMPSPAAADGWFAGLSVGPQQERFMPFYTEFDGGATTRFDNRTTGTTVNLFAGRHLRLGDRIEMAWQASVGISSFEWSLFLPEEPADIRYAIPFTIVGSVLPEVHVGGPVSLFAEVGAGAGRVRQTKEAPTTSTYDQHVTRPALAAGAGVRIEASPRLDVVAQYRYLRYGGFDYDASTLSGELIEHVRETPRSHGVFAGIVARF
jgi:opacity protein-like surface antigen